jgi:hypothetical protein
MQFWYHQGGSRISRLTGKQAKTVLVFEKNLQCHPDNTAEEIFSQGNNEWTQEQCPEPPIEKTEHLG